ncbi:uncharacterized protein [Mytilus edulis]|uniref:uncharacterized protein n=1 Tax=Mytilus edulis TaxID=6550 RepID=UPI0039F026EE
MTKNGKALKTEREQAERWVQHFKEVLNYHEPDFIDDLNINTEPPTIEEVRNAIKSLKTGNDSINAEMLKADLDTSSKILHNFECSVILDSSIADSFEVKSGVRQGCIMSLILFLLAIDWIQRNTKSDKKRGIQWTMFNQLEDLDIAILPITSEHLKEKTNILQCTNTCVKQTGLNANAKRTKVMSVNTRNTTLITINDQPVDSVEDFTYLGGIISKDNGTGKDIKARLSKARATFAGLHIIWKSNQYSLRTKLRIYNNNVKPVILYGSETWRVLVSDLQKVDAFHTSCLRKINRIFWSNKISNKRILEKCNATVLGWFMPPQSTSHRGVVVGVDVEAERALIVTNRDPAEMSVDQSNLIHNLMLDHQT